MILVDREDNLQLGLYLMTHLSNECNFKIGKMNLILAKVKVMVFQRPEPIQAKIVINGNIKQINKFYT